jgi:TRAP-type mannitol/chloroaromatic compound transport system permease small subunit
MDIDRVPGSFMPLLSMYVDIAKSIIGLASGTIALVVGSVVFHLNGAVGAVFASFASPLFLLALSLIWGALFMPALAFDYETYRHSKNKKTYTRFKYSRNLAFGFSTLACFAIGYCWLICIVVWSH